MLYARLDLITADPLALGGCITFIEREVRPAAESRPGNLGVSLLSSPESGAAVLESFWASRDALAASEQAEAPQYRELARRAQGSVTSEQYQLPVFERAALLDGGEEVRLTRIEVKPSAVADVIEVFGDSAVPELAEATGFRGALLFADPGSGHLISESAWWDAQARAASPSVAALIRSDLLESANCVIRAVDDYSLVFSSTQEKPARW
jgi:heme-degrading monooxygenase HmoA